MNGHTHEHRFTQARIERAFAIGIALNVGFAAAEAAFGFIAGSLALLADAAHNLTDVLGLVLAWGAALLAQRRPSPRFTYGMRISSIWAAMLNALVLLVVCGAMGWEAISRFTQPRPVQSLTVIAVAAVGVAINIATALAFARGRQHDLNVRGAFMHMAADAAVSLGVVVSGMLTLATGWLWLDPLATLAIVVVIVFGTWGLLRDSVSLGLNAVPSRIDPAVVRAWLEALAGVTEVHDLHIWAMSTSEVALTAHLVMPGAQVGDQFYEQVAHELEHRFGIHHATLQVERGDAGNPCKLSPEHVV
ncbi:MAG: cation transporter [Betaproteobacteria bacterium]|nr:cation transporter [Betaproteobacteria bacterium]